MAAESVNERKRLNHSRDIEYKCSGCGEWSEIDRWQCLGFTDEDVPDVDSDCEPVYCGDDAIACPRCGLSQQSPGAFAVQSVIDFGEVE